MGLEVENWEIKKLQALRSFLTTSQALCLLMFWCEAALCGWKELDLAHDCFPPCYQTCVACKKVHLKAGLRCESAGTFDPQLWSVYPLFEIPFVLSILFLQSDFMWQEITAPGPHLHGFNCDLFFYSVQHLTPWRRGLSKHRFHFCSHVLVSPSESAQEAHILFISASCVFIHSTQSSSFTNTFFCLLPVFYF